MQDSEQSKTDTALTISVLVPTKDRPDDLKQALQSLARQSLLPREILIVDQSRFQLDLQTIFTEEEWHTLRPLVRYIYDPQVSGAAEARNVILEQASAAILLFIDDDSVLEPDCLHELRECYLRYPEVVGVGGLITNYKRPPRSARLWSNIFVHGPFYDERQPIYWRASELHGNKPLPVHKFTGAAMSFRADAVRNIRFDRNLTGGSLAEDIDFCLTLGNQLLVIAPTVRLVHKRSPINRKNSHWLYEHARSAYYLYGRHWRVGILNWLWFLWLKIGYGTILPLACIRRGSLEPWQRFRNGRQTGRNLAADTFWFESNGLDAFPGS